MNEDIDAGLASFQRSKWQQLRNATRLALENRRKVEGGDFSVFLIPLVVALTKDFFLDPLSEIPIVGQLIVGLLFCLPVTVYLFIFMWGRGKMWLRFVFFIIAFLDLIPIINLIPFDTFAVWYAYHLAKKDADRAKGVLEKLDQAVPRIADDLRGVERQRALAQAAAEAEVAASTEEAAILSSQERAMRTPAMATPLREIPSLRQNPRAATSTDTRLSPPTVPGSLSSESRQSLPPRVAANDVVYRQGQAAANDGVMRIRAAGARLAESAPARRVGPSTQPSRSGSPPVQTGGMRRAA